MGADSSQMCLVSRILYSPVRRTAIIHLGRKLPNGSSGLPGNAVRLATGTEPGRFLFVSLFGLAPRGVCLAAHVATRAGALLLLKSQISDLKFHLAHLGRTVSPITCGFRSEISKSDLPPAGLFSVALVVGQLWNLEFEFLNPKKPPRR